MRYYKFADDFMFAEGITYIEVDDGWTQRQITVAGEQCIASNINYPQWGFVLSDQKINHDDFEEVVPITQEEFDVAWRWHCAQHQHEWEAAKGHFPNGTQLIGAIIIFYPQGVIIDLGSNTFGVADYAQCRASAKPEWIYSKHRVKAVVAGYDEENQWIKLQEPQVLEESVG